MKAIRSCLFVPLLAGLLRCAHPEPLAAARVQPPAEATDLPRGFYRESWPDGGTQLWEQNPDGGPPFTMGSLLKEEIRQTVHANRNQIRNCYEVELFSAP